MKQHNVKNRSPSAHIFLADVWWCNRNRKISRYTI